MRDDISRDWEDRVIRESCEARGGNGGLSPELRREFGRLIAEHEPRVFRVCLRITGDEEMSRELTQDALFTAYNKLPQWQGECRFGTWLCGIAKNLARNAIRRRHDFLFEDGLLETEDLQQSVLKDLTRAEREHLVSECAKDVLDKLEQTVVEMRYSYNMPLAQITENLRIEGSGARKVLQQAMRKLRPEMRRRLRVLGHGTSFVKTSF